METLRSVSAPTGELLTIPEACRRSGKSERWVRRARRFGRVEAAEIDGHHAVTAGSLSAYLQRVAARRPKKRPLLRLVVNHT
jgi:hypothetical protein